MDRTTEMKLRRFFEACMKGWERRHGRRPRTREEMWEAFIDGMDRSCSERPKN